MKKWIKALAFLIVGAAIVFGVLVYRLFRPNMKYSEGTVFYLRSEMTYDDLLDSLRLQVLADPSGFGYLAERMNLRNHLYPGMYHFPGNVNNVDLLRQLRSGNRQEVSVQIPGQILPTQVFGILGRLLEADSLSMAKAFFDSNAAGELGLSGPKWSCIFQANTYRFQWATKPEDVTGRFVREYRKFWNQGRLNKASELGLSPAEVVILASIVDAEANKMQEMPTIAGVYLNRLRNGWPLQADPTVMFMVRQEGRQRVLNKDKAADHPYNTYKRKGLPPGPIMPATAAAIEAVLTPEDHDYMFFCAREDFSGFHRFSKTYEEHQKYARAYQQELDRRGIME